MLLEPQELDRFYRLQQALMSFVNERLKAIPDRFTTPREFADLPPETRVKLRDALLANLDLIDGFVAENPARLTADDLDIVRSWRHFVTGRFYVDRELKKYTVFLSTDKPTIAYGVVGLSESFEVTLGQRLPLLTKTVLLPFKDKIVYDGMLTKFGLSFGPGMRRNLKEDFKQAKLSRGIVTSLPMSANPLPTKAKPRPKAQPTKEKTAEVTKVIIGMTDQFCRENLNEEYAVLCRRLAEKLSRKRPSPILSGKPITWACGIVRTIGWVNFLHDKRYKPFMLLCDIDACFRVSSGSGSAKQAAILKMMKIKQMDPDWSLPGREGQIPKGRIFPKATMDLFRQLLKRPKIRPTAKENADRDEGEA